MKALASIIPFPGEFDLVRLENAISRLPDEYKKAIIFRYRKNLSRKEIASRLNWSLSKVNAKITRGITLLKYELNPTYFQQMDTILSTNLSGLAPDS